MVRIGPATGKSTSMPAARSDPALPENGTAVYGALCLRTIQYQSRFLQKTRRKRLLHGKCEQGFDRAKSFCRERGASSAGRFGGGEHGSAPFSRKFPPLIFYSPPAFKHHRPVTPAGFCAAPAGLEPDRGVRRRNRRWARQFPLDQRARVQVKRPQVLGTYRIMLTFARPRGGRCRPRQMEGILNDKSSMSSRMALILLPRQVCGKHPLRR